MKSKLIKKQDGKNYQLNQEINELKNKLDNKIENINIKSSKLND